MNSAMHQREADEPGALHHAERDRAAAHLLGQGPEDVAAVERQEREQVDHAERERDQREQEDGAVGRQLDRLARGLVGAHDAGDLLALLGLEDAGDRLDRGGGDEPHLVDAEPHRVDRCRRPIRVRSVVGEAEQRALQVGVVDRRDRDAALAPVADRSSPGPARRPAAVGRGAGAAMGAHLTDQRCGVAAPPVDRHHTVALLQDLRRRAVLVERLDRVRGRARGHAPDQQVARSASRTRARCSPPARPRSPRSASTPAGGSRRGARPPAGSPPPGSCR